jgi:hypothetical protein
MVREARLAVLRRDERGLLWALNPTQLVSVGVILLTIDLATFVGWAQAIKERTAGKPLKNQSDS